MCKKCQALLHSEIDSKLFSFQLNTHREPKAIYVGYKQWYLLKAIFDIACKFKIKNKVSSPSVSGFEFQGVPVVRVIADHYLEIG